MKNNSKDQNNTIYIRKHEGRIKERSTQDSLLSCGSGDCPVLTNDVA